MGCSALALSHLGKPVVPVEAVRVAQVDGSPAAPAQVLEGLLHGEAPVVVARLELDAGQVEGGGESRGRVVQRQVGEVAAREHVRRGRLQVANDLEQPGRKPEIDVSSCKCRR